ncbi:hypothetical protein S245_008374, partial [Arachis hypogaea]
AVLARVTTEKRMSMIKAREESEKSRAENKRRESTYVEDLFIVHIVGMDTMACGFKNAAKLIESNSTGDNFFKTASYTIKAVCAKSYEDTTQKLKNIEAQIALARYQEVTERYAKEKQFAWCVGK